MKLNFRQGALADIEAIHDFIAQNNPTAASRVVTRIRAGVKRLEMFPLSGRLGARQGTREVVVTGLPYIVVYQPTETIVDIIAVFHCAKNIERG